MSEDYTSIDYQMSILQAAKEGKAIEVCGRVHGRPSSEWRNRQAPYPPFNFAFYCYRVKPEPRTFKVWVKGNSIEAYYESHVIKSWQSCGWELVEVVEKLS